MANVKITDLSAYSNPAATDVLPIVDVGADVTKKVSIQDLLKNAGSGTAAAPGIAFDGDSNTGIYRPGADQLALSTNGTGRLFIDSSGRLLVGTSTASTATGFGTPNNQFAGDYQKSSILLRNNQNDSSFCGIVFQKIRSTSIVQQNDPLGYLTFNGYDGVTDRAGAYIFAEIDATPGSGDLPTRLVFSTTSDGASFPTEAVRIDSSRGLFTYTDQDPGFMISTARASGNIDRAMQIKYGATAINTGTVSFQIYTNGNVQNTNNSYGSISDLKLKENIVDANSQWDDLKALQVRNYNFKEGQTHTQIGLIAQEVELVSPGLVSESPDRDEDGNDLGTVTKSVNYSVLYMKAVKALQEAMERIETLEASNADLLARVAALEAS